jgi:prevent-host-death family protein
MERVTALEARRNLGKLLNLVSIKNEEIIIERAGTPIAKLTSCEPVSEKKIGQGDFRKMKGVGKSTWSKIDVEDYLTQERTQWD